MALVVKQAYWPASVASFENGLIPLASLKGLACADGHAYLFAPEVADQFEDMIVACAQECGVDLVFTPGGAYRSYDAQVSLFLQRYSKDFIAGRPVKTWLGVNYWLRNGMAEAAVPGTSNHGRAIAGDIAEWRDHSYVSISSSPAWPWVLNNADRFGFSWELQSEPWHLRLVRIVPLNVVPVPPVLPTLGEDVYYRDDRATGWQIWCVRRDWTDALYAYPITDMPRKGDWDKLSKIYGDPPIRAFADLVAIMDQQSRPTPLPVAANVLPKHYHETGEAIVA